MARQPYGYAPLSARAKQHLQENTAAVAARTGARPSTIHHWRLGSCAPSYAAVCSILRGTDHLDLRDFGYVELPTGEVARLLAPGHPPAPEGFYRADGRVACETCGRPYHRHPQDPRRDYLHVLCDGRRVKL